MALVVSFVLSIAATALAATPIEFGGDFKYEFRQNQDYGSKTYTENRMYADLKFNGKIDDSTTFFGRFAGMTNDRDSFAGANKTNGFTMDQFGVKGSIDDVGYVFGREATQLGHGGIFYAGTDIDPLTYFDGVAITAKTGVFNVKVIGGKSLNSAETTGINNNSQDWFGIDLSTKLGETTVGAAYANRTQSANNVLNGQAPDAKYTDFNLSGKLGVIDLAGEYVKSNANTASKAYTMSGTYAWDKDSFTIAYNDVQANAVDPKSSNLGVIYYPNGNAFTTDGSLTANSTGYKGLTYAYSHSMTKALGLNVYYMSLKPLTGPNINHSNNELGANLKWSF
jgi:hypothetical protein